MGTKPGNWLGKEKTACVLEAKNEKLIIMHTEMWEDSSDLVKRVKFKHNSSNADTERVPKSNG